jgi:hypothetical protein
MKTECEKCGRPNLSVQLIKLKPKPKTAENIAKNRGNAGLNRRRKRTERISDSVFRCHIEKRYRPNDPSSATAATRHVDCNRDVMPPFAAAHGSANSSRKYPPRCGKVKRFAGYRSEAEKTRNDDDGLKPEKSG